MSEQVDIAKQWLFECCDASEDGKVCACTIKRYIAQLEEAQTNFLGQIMEKESKIIDLEAELKPLTVDQIRCIKIRANEIKNREFADCGFDWSPAHGLSDGDVRIVLEAAHQMEEQNHE